MRYSKDDDDMTLGEMLREEKMKGGMSDQKNMDAEYAKAITGDGKYKVTQPFLIFVYGAHQLSRTI